MILGEVPGASGESPVIIFSILLEGGRVKRFSVEYLLKVKVADPGYFWEVLRIF